MPELPPTPQSLIARLKNCNDSGTSWEEFVAIYGPIIIGFLRAKGLQDADARDVTQDSFRAVARSIQGFDPAPEKGRFRNWLFVIVRNKLTDHRRKQKCETQGAGDSDAQFKLENIPDDSDQQLWDVAYKQRLLNWAAEQIKDEFSSTTWEAFWMTSVDVKSASEVAKMLEMTVSNVYVCKSRVIARLKDKVAKIEGEL